MGIVVFPEDQIHRRSDADLQAGEWVTRLLAVAPPAGILAGVHPWGDTMFNGVQLNQLLAELDGIRVENPDLAEAVDGLKAVAHAAVRRRGYLWLSGD
jgi:hypothetical protein